MGEAKPKVRMFGMDVDGVLTDGGIYYGDKGLEPRVRVRLSKDAVESLE